MNRCQRFRTPSLDPDSTQVQPAARTATCHRTRRTNTRFVGMGKPPPPGALHQELRFHLVPRSVALLGTHPCSNARRERPPNGALATKP
jgi:hypothetical protein